MRVLVIGQNGKLATSLQEQVLPSDITLATVSRDRCNLAVHASISAAVTDARPDVVVNAAAYTAVDQAEAEPDEAFAINAEGPGHLASTCRELGIPLIHVSTDYVFDGTKGAPYVESDPVAPLGAYGASKATGQNSQER